MEKNTIDDIYDKTPNAKDFARSYCKYLGELLLKLDYEAIEGMIDYILSARANDKKVYIIGNGGSAATSSHMANDFAIGTTRVTKKPFQFISLTDNNAVITAIANDFGYELIFTKQLEVLMKRGDLLIAISASGNSENIIQAVEYATSLGNKVIGLTGFDGGKLSKISNVCINVETPKGEYGPVEDIHMVLDHLISNYLNKHVKD
ncbi:SIS domain-containing protein [Bacteriovoracales bacterium]|nr:SIS domain-containing protein [Bacteriovoracales bacterium]